MAAAEQRYLPEILDRLDRLEIKSAMAETPIGEFKAELTSDGTGVRVSWTIRDGRSVKKISLRRNTTLDPGSAHELISYGIPFSADQKYEYLDQDAALKGATGNYWLVLQNDNAANTKIVGPQSATLNADLGTPDQIVSFDASLGPASGVGAYATQKVNISITPPATRFGSVQILVSGYQGVAQFVAVAQSASYPFSFNLKKTGEAITLKAVTVSPAGKPAANGPTKALVLNGAETVPAKILSLAAAETANGVQISFTPGAEADVAMFQIWRAVRNAGFGAASNIGTVAPTGAWRYTYLDTAGLGGQFEWFVVAVGPAGSSAASSAVTNIVLNSSADLPPNVPTNNTNYASVDSIDNGTNATIRVYGTGGVGSSWTRATGYGSGTYPSWQQAGYSYATKYYVLYDTRTLTYTVVTTYPATLPDGFVWVGTVTTVAAGGGGGTTGGGGSTGGSGGGRYSGL